MIVRALEKRSLCILLQSWLLLGQIVWFSFFLSSNFQVTPLSGVACGDTKMLRLSTPDKNSPSNATSERIPDPRAVDAAFLEFMGPSDKRLAILEGRYDLVWMGNSKKVTSGTGPYHGVEVSFCPVNWDEQKREPNTVPRYRNVFEGKRCDKDELAEVMFDLADLMRMIRRYDQITGPFSKAKQMDQAGLIYHESRCGSTLVSNMLTVANPDTTRVYSEPLPLLQAMESGNEQLVMDVMFLFGRTTKDSKEKRVFYKLKSDAVRHIDVMPESVPWIFLYRTPEEVMSSHFNPTEEVSTAVCVQDQERTTTPPFIEEIANKFGTPYQDMSAENFCAVRLASLCLGAIRHHERTGTGRFVNYNTLPESLWKSFGPEHFGLHFSSKGIERMKNISSVYSKGRKDETKIWEHSSKLKLVTKEQQKASHDILRPYYKRMEEFAKQKVASARKKMTQS